MKRIQKCTFRYHDSDIFSCIVAMGEQFVPKALHITQPKNAGCMEGTRKEVLGKFLSWVMHDPNRIFWLAGLAGMGKTSIALTLCRLLQYEPQVILGGAFFCSRTVNKKERTDPGRILPTLATIMAEQSPEFAAAMEEELRIGANPHAADQPADVQAECLLRKPLASLSTSSRIIVFVIDALDECIDETQVGELLQAIATLARDTRVKFILTSRPETHIAYHPIFKSDDRSILRLHAIDKTEVFKDIHLYITNSFSAQPLGTTWYNNEDITALATRSDGVFIFASTMTKYVLEGKGPRQRSKRLDIAKVAGHNNSEVALGPLDAMYEYVLTRASDGREVEPEELEATLQALACILAAREPLSVAILADLLERDTEDLRGSLERLHSILHITEDIDERALRTIHASFGDYLFERAASKVRIPRSLGDEELAKNCLRIMDKLLYFNVAQSQSSYEFNQKTRPDSITLALEYACLQWIYHVSSLPDPSILYQMISEVFRPRALFWLEVMSILGHIQHALAILDHASATVRDATVAHSFEEHLQVPDLSQFLRDTHAFLISFREPIESSAPHIYLSALPFEPKDSLVYRTFFPHCGGLVTVDVRGISHSRHVTHDGHAIPSLSAHESPVNSVMVSLDGTVFVSASDDRSVRVWDARTGDQKLPPLLGHEGSVYSVAIAPDGSMIASASEDSTVRLWDAKTGVSAGEPIRGHDKGVTSVKFSPDSRWLISGSTDGTVRIWDVATRLPSGFTPLHCHSGVTAVAITPDGQIIASGDSTGEIHLWKAANGDMLRTWQVKLAEQRRKSSWGYDQEILSLEFSRKGTHILSVGRQWADETNSTSNSCAQEFVGSVWDVTTGQCTCALKGNGRAELQQVLAYSLDHRLIASGSVCSRPNDGCNVRLWDALTGQIIATASTRGNSARTVALTPDCHSLLIGWGIQIWVWDVWTARSQFVDDIGDAVAALTGNIFSGKPDLSNWILGPSRELLLWVPPEYQLHLHGGAFKLVIGPARVSISRDPNGLHYGYNWTLCWKQM